MVLNFAENHDYWQKFFDPILGSQKQKYFIQLWWRLKALTQFIRRGDVWVRLLTVMVKVPHLLTLVDLLKACLTSSPRLLPASQGLQVQSQVVPPKLLNLSLVLQLSVEPQLTIQL